MSTTKDLNLSFAEIGRSLRQPLANSTIAYRGSAMGFSSGRVRPLVSGDDFAGFLTAKSDNRAFAAGADPLPVQLITQGLVEVAVTGVVATSIGATVYASDENTFNLTSGSTIGTVQVWVEDGLAVIAFEAFSVVGIDFTIASQAEAEAGTENTTMMTPLRTAQAITAQVATVATDTIWDAAGDLAVGSGANTAARLAKGAALQVLRVNSGATALEWAATGSVATDAIWDAAGDLAVGSGANTAARLAKGAALQVLRVNAGATALEWADEAAGSGSGGGGGSDRTAVTTQADPVNGGQRVWKETIDGFEHTYGYDAQGNLILDEWAAGGLQRDIEYTTVPGFGIASGNRYVNGGQIYVPSADMPALKTGLIALGAVVVPAQFWVPEYHCAFCWDEIDQRFRPASGGEVSLGVTLTKPTVTIPNGSYSSNAYSLTLPGWMRGKGGRLRIWTHWGFVTSNSISKDVKTIVNGADVQISTTSAGTTAAYQHDSTLYFESDSAAFHLAAGTGAINSPSGASSNTSSAALTKPTYTANTDLTITAQIKGNADPGASNTATIERVELFYY